MRNIVPTDIIVSFLYEEDNYFTENSSLDMLEKQALLMTTAACSAELLEHPTHYTKHPGYNT